MSDLLKKHHHKLHAKYLYTFEKWYTTLCYLQKTPVEEQQKFDEESDPLCSLQGFQAVFLPEWRNIVTQIHLLMSKIAKEELHSCIRKNC